MISPAFPPDSAGEAEYTAQLAGHLSSRGHQVTVLTRQRSSPPTGTAYHVAASMPGWGWRQWLQFRREINACAPDGVILVYTSWLFKEHAMVTYLPTFLGWWRPKARLLTIFQTDDGAKSMTLLHRVIRKLAELASPGRQVHHGFGTLLDPRHTIGVLGPSIGQSIQAQAPNATMRSILMPPPPLLSRPSEAPSHERQHMRARLGLAASDTLLLSYFGYVYPGKGVETLFAALALMVQRGRPVALVMVGGGRQGSATATATEDPHSGFEQQMRELAASLGIAHLVSWQEGYDQGDAEPGKDLGMSDIAVLPFDDGAELRRSSIAVVAASGLPIITTTPARGETAFVHEQNVLLCPPQSPTLLADAICRVADEPVLRQTLQRGAIDLVNNWYSWQASIAQIEAAL
jgi:glycosyltransferase involved in cell wall biosynthesis